MSFLLVNILDSAKTSESSMSNVKWLLFDVECTCFLGNMSDDPIESDH